MSYQIDLSGRVALVTGASGGLGAQFARVLAKAGAGVALAGRRVEKLKACAPRSRLKAATRVVALDVTDHDSIRSAVAHTETEVGTMTSSTTRVATTQPLIESSRRFDYVFDVTAPVRSSWRRKSASG
jgi:NAD(P)-dependent dehydrogenase (short-subunit alcohol dehydrogenase family)